MEQGQAVCQQLGMSSEPWKQLPCALPAAAEALLCMEGLSPFAGEAPGAMKRLVLLQSCLWQSWEAEPFPAEPGAVSLLAALPLGS